MSEFNKSVLSASTVHYFLLPRCGAQSRSSVRNSPGVSRGRRGRTTHRFKLWTNFLQKWSQSQPKMELPRFWHRIRIRGPGKSLLLRFHAKRKNSINWPGNVPYYSKGILKSLKCARSLCKIRRGRRWWESRDRATHRFQVMPKFPAEVYPRSIKYCTTSIWTQDSNSGTLKPL